jgi:hypothetical protein
MEKVVRIYARLFQDGAERSFGHVAGMIRDRRIAIGAGVVPDLMTTGGLSIELESTSLEPSNDLAITKAREPAHLRGHDDGVVATAGGRWKGDIAFSFAACFNELASNVARDIEGLRDGPPLRH